MKNSCEIIKDLLPLYHDEVCSEESRKLVEDHISECTSCKTELENIGVELKSSKQDIDGVAILKKISAKWHNGKIKAFARGVTVATIICIILIGGYFGLTELKIFSVDSSKIQIRDVCQLQDGRIAYHVYINDKKDLRHIKYDVDNNKFYAKPYRALLESNRITKEGLYNGYQTISTINFDCEAYYFGTDNNAVLIWEKGTELPKASEELEKLLSYTQPYDN